MILAIVLVGGIAYEILRPHEPVYHGKTFSEWLADYDGTNPNADEVKAKLAITRIGSNAVPVLIEWMRAKDSPVKLWMANLLRKQTVIKFHFQFASDYHNRALKCFEILGPVGKSAIPDLVGLLDDPTSGDSGYFAVDVLSRFGLEVMPILINALTNTHQSSGVQRIAAEGLGRLGSEGHAAVPALVQVLQSNDAFVRVEAAGALGHIGQRADAAIPVLLDALARRGGLAGFEVLRYFYDFKSQAQTAVPLLLKRIEVCDATEQSMIIDALRLLDAKAATETEERLRSERVSKESQEPKVK